MLVAATRFFALLIVVVGALASFAAPLDETAASIQLARRSDDFDSLMTGIKSKGSRMR